ncbi:TylF/MycF family methyltransferase [Chitinophaga nivalis]|uniref:TylF/MycF family methyltransferase n=1 Tax=Chitinophaga nivalis TaxID=2991709 RepID=A0ABT3IIY7_9BACT|nr:TylF/MycF family methyltransferase [Chitinophaga nivalis]MCW3466406.1 TylF/MycF family methyltransferase [Chitinophaga nivalis]MCW3483903.1 TylF/MycF family methyltransferase [Chitinophaga nivalis]
MYRRYLSSITFIIIRLLEYPFYLLSRLWGSSYQLIIPANTYAPWLRDYRFNKVFRRVKKNSLVNKYQAWELWKAVEQAEKIPGDILEVGVWRGSTSIIMAEKLRENRSLKVIYACDTFEGVVKAGDKYDNYYKGGEHSDTSREMVEGFIKAARIYNVQLLEGVFPDDTAELLIHKSFCLCHIDVDAYASAKSILEWVWPRITVGGTIFFNDYGFPLTQGIAQLVNEQYSLPDRIVLHNLNGNGIIIKIK